MAFDGTTGCWWPDMPMTKASEPRLRIAQYGDGYEQRTLDGINFMKLTWSLSFTRRASTLLAMDAYLVAQGGGAFLFLDPTTQLLHRVFCDQWSIQWEMKKWNDGVRKDFGTLTAEFRKANGVTA